MKKFFKKLNFASMFFDWYIREYHSTDYIHKNKIKKEITKQIKVATDKLAKRKDADKEDAIISINTQHAIEKDGLYAQIDAQDEYILESAEMRKETEKLYFKCVKWGRELAMVPAQNKYEMEKIINNISVTMGQFDKSEIKIQGINKQIQDSRDNDEKTLGIKE